MKGIYKKSVLKELAYQYLVTLIDYYSIIGSIKFLKKSVILTFGEDKDILNKLNYEQERYINNLKSRIKILNFTLKNEKNLYYENICRVFDELDNIYLNINKYIQELFENLTNAISTEIKYKFYYPRNNPKFITKDDLEKFMNYIKGFNIDDIKEFLTFTGVFEDCMIDDYSIRLKSLSENNLNNISNTNDNIKIKELNIDLEKNLDLFGLYENNDGKLGIIIPSVNDEKSSLVAVHELVHGYLVLKKNEINNEQVVYSEDLPILYELLYKKYNYFVNIDIHTTDIAQKLFNDYQNEPIAIQIDKAKKLIR